MDPAALIQRILDRPLVAYVMAIMDAYGKAAGGLLANGLAFTALFAVIPIGLVTLGLAGSFIGDPRIQAALAAALIEAFPPLESLIVGVLEALAGGAVVTSVIGLLGLVWTVSQFYVALDVAFSRIFAAQRERDPLRRTLRGFVWVAVLLGSVIALIVVGTLASAAEALLPGEFPFDAVGELLPTVPVMIAITIAIVAVAYRVLPPSTPRWRSIALPAVIVGLAIVGLTQLFIFLAPRLVGVASLAGSLAAAFVALAWLSFLFQALLIGAAWVRVRDRGPTSGLASPAAPTEASGGGQ